MLHATVLPHAVTLSKFFFQKLAPGPMRRFFVLSEQNQFFGRFDSCGQDLSLPKTLKRLLSNNLASLKIEAVKSTLSSIA